MKAIIIITMISMLTYACLIKLSDRICEKQQLKVSKTERLKPSETQANADKVIQQYFGKEMKKENFATLNAMTSDQLDTIIKRAGF